MNHLIRNFENNYGRPPKGMDQSLSALMNDEDM